MSFYHAFAQAHSISQFVHHRGPTAFALPLPHLVALHLTEEISRQARLIRRKDGVSVSVSSHSESTALPHLLRHSLTVWRSLRIQHLCRVSAIQYTITPTHHL